jgi:type II secretory pathway pseudopilin PulG
MKNVECRMKRQQGFTLIEIMVAVFGFTLIVFGLIALVSQIFGNANQQSNLLADSDQARRLAFSIVNELRNSQTANNGAYALDTAAAQQLIFYSNIDTDILIEKVRYYVSGGKLWKGVTEYNGTSYIPASESTFVVQNNIANGVNPLFLYYDGTYTGSSTQTSLTPPVNVTAVKLVKVRLDIFNRGGVANTNYYTVTSSGTIRNLKTNLGN